MASRTAEEKKEDFRGKERCVVMGGAHQILNSRDGTDNRIAEEKGSIRVSIRVPIRVSVRVSVIDSILAIATGGRSGVCK